MAVASRQNVNCLSEVYLEKEDKKRGRQVGRKVSLKRVFVFVLYIVSSLNR